MNFRTCYHTVPLPVVTQIRELHGTRTQLHLNSTQNRLYDKQHTQPHPPLGPQTRLAPDLLLCCKFHEIEEDAIHN